MSTPKITPQDGFNLNTWLRDLMSIPASRREEAIRPVPVEGYPGWLDSATRQHDDALQMCERAQSRHNKATEKVKALMVTSAILNGGRLMRGSER